jgi:hypothetical protein
MDVGRSTERQTPAERARNLGSLTNFSHIPRAAGQPGSNHLHPSANARSWSERRYPGERARKPACCRRYRFTGRTPSRK